MLTEPSEPISFTGFEWPVALQLAEALRNEQVREALGIGPLGFDLLAHAPCAGPRPLTLEDAERVHERFARYSARLGKAEWRGTTADVSRALALAAREHPFHPVVDWLTTLVWDGESRLGLLAAALGVPEAHAPIATALLQRWMTSAVARAFQPGLPYPVLLALVGHSEVADVFFQMLVPPAWYHDAPAAQGLPSLRAPGRHPWICLRSDLGDLIEARPAELAALLQATSDVASGPFTPEGEPAPRTTLLVGQLAELPAIIEPALRRCVWAVPIGLKPDPVGLEEWRDQLWAEIVGAHRGDRLELSSRHEVQRRALSSSLAGQDPLTDSVLDAVISLENERERYSESSFITMSRILTRAGISHKTPSMAVQHRVGAILRANGFEQRRMTAEAMRRIIWARVGASDTGRR